MHVVVNGRRAGSVQMPRAREGGRFDEQSTPVKPPRLRAVFDSPTVTPVASPDGIAASQNRLLVSGDESVHVLTHTGSSAGTSLQSQTQGDSLAHPDRTAQLTVQYSLPPSKLRSPTRRNLANELNVEDLEGLDDPLQDLVEAASESTETLQNRNHDLRGQLEVAMALLDAKRQTLRALSSSAHADKADKAAPADEPPLARGGVAATTVPPSGEEAMRSNVKTKRIQRARLKRSMLLARGLGTTRLQLKQLRQDVVSAQQQLAQEMDAVVSQVSAAVANVGSSRGDVIVSSSRMAEFMEMQMCAATMVKDLIVGAPRLHLAAGHLSTPSLSTAEVGDWLSSEGLAEHVAAFADHAVDGKALMELTDTQLRDDLQVLQVGHRNIILAARRQLCNVDNFGPTRPVCANHSACGQGAECRKSSFFRPPRLQLATSLRNGKRAPRSKLLPRANKARLAARLAAVNGPVGAVVERNVRHRLASTMVLDSVGDTHNRLGCNQQLACADDLVSSRSTFSLESVSGNFAENDSDTGSSAGSCLSACVSASEDRYSDDFDALSLTTIETDTDFDNYRNCSEITPPVHGRSSCAWVPCGLVPNDSESNATASEVAEELDGEIAYGSDFERMSSTSSWTVTSSKLHQDVLDVSGLPDS